MVKQSVVYHGSPVNVDVLKPSLTRRRHFINGKLDIAYEGISLHATPQKWIAISYLRNKNIKFIHKNKPMYFSVGVSLFNKSDKSTNKKKINIYGKRNLEYSLSKIFTDGYLYSFPSSSFVGKETIKGLGDLEVVSFNEEIPKKKIFISDPVKTMRNMGVKFKFIDLTKRE
jgi:hypothetical protein